MSTAGAGPLVEEFPSHELPTNPSVPLSRPGDLSRVRQISTPDSKAKDTNSAHYENPSLYGEGSDAKDNLDADTSTIDHEAIDRADGDHDEFLRLRAKMQGLKQKAKDIIQVQALKAEFMELQEMLGGQPDSNRPDSPGRAIRETSDVLLGMEMGDRYRDEGLDQLYACMPEEYRRKPNWRPYEAMKHMASTAAQRARPSPFLEGYIHPQPDDLAFEFTRRRLRARYSYEREMEYLYAVQERYDGMRAEALEREMLKKEAQILAEEEEAERMRPPVAQDGSEKEPSHHESDAESSEPSEAEIFAEPSMKRVEWLTFKAIRRQSLDSGARFVLEVLIGEPELSYDVLGLPIHRRPTNKSDDVSKERKTATKNFLLGQAPLPERIRINSFPLHQLFINIHNDDVLHEHGSFIMTRPFKALSYYEKNFRLWRDALEKMVGVPAEDAEEEEEEEEKEKGTELTPEDELLDEILEAVANPSVALQHLTCLLDFIDVEITAKEKHLLNDNYQMVTFSDLWYLFKPGNEVIGQSGRQAYRILTVTSPQHKGVLPWGPYYNRFEDSKAKEKPMRIHCVYVDFDGKRLGPVSEEFEIEAFDGEKSIALLPLQPFRFSKTPELREKLIERGRKFVTMASVKHMHCSGLTLDSRDEVDSQVVVDFAEALSTPANKDWRPKIEELLGVIPDDDGSEECSAECCRYEAVHDDSYVDRKRNEEFMGSLNPQDRSRLPSVAVYPRTLEELEREGLTDDELLIMSYRVFGFVLRTRKWAPLDLADVVDVQPEEDGQGKRETPFDKLVLPPGHKQMVQSLIAQHFRDKELGASRNEQVDFVRGKGKGLILLLHGAPGVGKTTTAECVADLFQKPLFQITCGDLGSTAKDVEATLETNFSLANRWGCILLLDEADVFLAARSPTDFTRNGLVAVFLRVLEYYAGILFLTTNRVGDFDEAFASRIHISLYYPPLTLASTIQVFQLNFAMIRERFRKKGRKVHIDEEILEFAREHFLTNEKARWNGRQIRNACQTALALAEFEAQGGHHDAVVDAGAEVRLQQKHLKTVTDAYLEFTHYLKDIFGAFADERAQDQNLRAQSKMSNLANPLFSYNSHGSQTSPSASNIPAAQRGYPSGPMQQPAQPFYQPPYPQQFSSGFAYGSAGNSQNMQQQIPQIWPGIMNMGIPGPHGATGPSQQEGLPTGTTAFLHGQANVHSPKNQDAPHDK